MIPLSIYAESVLSVSKTDQPSPTSRKTLRQVEEYIYARKRTVSCYAVLLDNVHDIEVHTPDDVDKLRRTNLRTLEVDETVQYFYQRYYPTTWIRRSHKWVPFEFFNLAVWGGIMGY